MEHPESVTAVLTANEPPNGARLVLDKGDEWKVIVRDDGEARAWGIPFGDDQHWFYADDFPHDPMALHQYLKYVKTVYAIGEKLADF